MVHRSLACTILIIAVMLQVGQIALAAVSTVPPRFLSLPFNDPTIKVQQGWFYRESLKGGSTFATTRDSSVVTATGSAFTKELRVRDSVIIDVAGVSPQRFTVKTIKSNTQFIALQNATETLDGKNAIKAELHLGSGAIDYIKGENDQSSTWKPFDVVAAAPGIAMQSSGGGYGNFVLIKHNEADENGNRFFTLYAHLEPGSIDPTIPFHKKDCPDNPKECVEFNKWRKGSTQEAKGKLVNRGHILGKADQTGTGKCSSKNCIHLHFQVFRGGYATQSTDPYDIEDVRDFYPDFPQFTNCGPNVLWTTCPPEVSPVVPNSHKENPDYTHRRPQSPKGEIEDTRNVPC